LNRQHHFSAVELLFAFIELVPDGGQKHLINIVIFFIKDISYPLYIPPTYIIKHHCILYSTKTFFLKRLVEFHWQFFFLGS
jgi:hypothetical protein